MFDYTGDNMTLTDPISFPIDLIQGYAYHLLFTLVYTRVLHLGCTPSLTFTIHGLTHERLNFASPFPLPL